MISKTFSRTSACLTALGFAAFCTAAVAAPDAPQASHAAPHKIESQHASAAYTGVQEVVVVMSGPEPQAEEGFDNDPLMTPWRRYVDGQLIVMYQDGPDSAGARTANRYIGAKVIQPFPAMRGALVQLPAGMSVPDAVAKYSQLPGVINMSPNAVADDADNVAVLND